jgi:magnesium-transporting ATPase (P-type)
MKFDSIQEFGFCNIEQFFQSLVRPNLLSISIPAAIIGGFTQLCFGVEPIVLIAFVALLTLEVSSGIFASAMEGKKITSKRMKSFLMMLFVWLVALFILHTFEVHFEDQFLENIFNYLFTATLVFVNVIYFKSIWENAARIMDKKSEFKKFSRMFENKFKN